MAVIVLAHGWGFDSTIWDAVRERLDAAHRVETVDFGFFGAPHAPKVSPADTVTDPVIVVGHSLGACWGLIEFSIPWQRLLLINGFARFTECAGFAPAVTPRVLGRMQKQFAKSPKAVLDEFRAFCGAPSAPEHFNAPRLAAGLDWLAQWDGRARLAERAAAIHALASRNDPIVPPGMSRHALLDLPPAQVGWSDAAGHLLPLAAPDLCAAWINRLATA